ncbi:MAG: hypothetical protein QOC81_2532 [Thermoanaerobaculia bacterium]|jgi:peptidoglycan/xylan/chitin deacetylase (PgdA/CDA1 family)|nr:hypothetical protein [Thermoanaerobaculia bacterium]
MYSLSSNQEMAGYRPSPRGTSVDYLGKVHIFALALALATLTNVSQPRIIILGYHEVEKDGLPPHAVIPRQNASAPAADEMARYTVSTETFRQQMDALDTHGYEVIALADVVDYLAGRRPSLPARSAVITIDDGWRSTGSEVAAELSKRHWPFTAFVYPRVIDRHFSHPYNLTWAEVAALAKKGVDIESHTYSHPFLARARHLDLAGDDYAAFLADELRCSRGLIASATGQPVRFLAYPYGNYDDDVIAAAKAAGYEAAVTVKPGVVTMRSNPLALERYLVQHDTAMRELEGWLEGR